MTSPSLSSTSIPSSTSSSSSKTLMATAIPSSRLLQLPHALISNIFSHLPLCEQIDIRIVSQHCNLVAQKETYCHSLLLNTQIDRIRNVVTTRTNIATRPSLNGFIFLNILISSKENLDFLVTRNHPVEKLTIINSCRLINIRLLNTLTSLRSLSISPSPATSDVLDPLNMSDITTLSTLTSLHTLALTNDPLSEGRITITNSLFPALTSLFLNNFTTVSIQHRTLRALSLDDSAVKNMMGKAKDEGPHESKVTSTHTTIPLFSTFSLPALQSLRLGSHIETMFSKNELEAIAKTFPHISELAISSTSSVAEFPSSTDPTLKTADTSFSAPLFSRLTSFSWGKLDLNWDVITAFLTSTLKTLEIGGSYSTMRERLPILSSVVQLDLYWPHTNSSKNYESIFESFPQLTSCILHHSVTDSSILVDTGMGDGDLFPAMFSKLPTIPPFPSTLTQLTLNYVGLPVPKTLFEDLNKQNIKLKNLSFEWCKVDSSLLWSHYTMPSLTTLSLIRCNNVLGKNKLAVYFEVEGRSFDRTKEGSYEIIFISALPYSLIVEQDFQKTQNSSLNTFLEEHQRELPSDVP